MQSNQDNRRYEILDVIGQGGFGTVYRARLLGNDGFSKEVAIKLLDENITDEEVLQRFRDEARILGLLSDRAVVSVENPAHLNGQWAVIMEYVRGESTERLMNRKVKIQPGVALEIISEIARALDVIWNQLGPDGEPLHLLHRDIKPGNIQITPGADVKLLDFGIAKADFAQREAKTTNHIGGTPGFIAPERLYGDEFPSGDIYSLGVVLHLFITGKMPLPPGRKKPADDEPMDDHAPTVIVSDFRGQFLALDISKAMRHGDPDQRPTATEVETMCQEALQKCHPPRLRKWAKEHISESPSVKTDDLVGRVISRTMSGIPRRIDTLNQTKKTRSNAPIILFAMVIGALGLFMALIGVWLIFF